MVHPTSEAASGLTVEERSDYLRRQAAANYLSVTIRQLDIWTKAGLLNPSRLGRVVLYSRRELAAFVEANREVSS